METDDSELARRVQQGDRSAFQELVTGYQGQVFRLAYRLLRDREEARDIVQEAFLNAYTGINRYNPDRPFAAWLYQIALNQCRNRLRRRSRVVFEPLEEAMGEAGHAESSGLTNPQLSPEQSQLARELRRAVEGALASLPWTYRTILVLRELEGLSYEDLTHVLGCSIGTVKSRLFRARKALQDRLQPYIEGEGSNP